MGTTSRANLDITASCNSCQREAGASRTVCPPCGGVWHRKCRDEGGMEKIEGVWLCAPCVKDTKLWHKEEFDFEEEDRDANTVGTVASKGKSKASKAKPKKRDFDLITLSSDEEEEVEEEEDEDDEVEFLAEME